MTLVMDEKSADVDDQLGRLVIWRTAEEGSNKIALLVDKEIDREVSVGEAIGPGVVIEVLRIKAESDEDQSVGLRVIAPKTIWIERQEKVVHPTPPNELDAAGLSELDELELEDASIDELEDWIAEGKRSLVWKSAYLRDVKEQLRKAYALGYHHGNNDGHMRYTMLAEEANIATEQREELAKEIENAEVMLKRRRRERSEKSGREFHTEFFRLAKKRLANETFEELKQEAAKLTANG